MADSDHTRRYRDVQFLNIDSTSDSNSDFSSSESDVDSDVDTTVRYLNRPAAATPVVITTTSSAATAAAASRISEKASFYVSPPIQKVPRQSKWLPAWVPRWGQTKYSRRCYSSLAIVIVAAIVIGALAASDIFNGSTASDPQVPPDGLSPPWYPTPKGGIAKSWATSYSKAADMVSRMTLPEKVNVTTGTGWSMGLTVGSTGPANNVGFPSLALQDGPLGLRFADNATAFPAGITVGATWNKQLMYQRGQAHALEARSKGINVLLGPSVGALGRMPAGGRNWEGFGADPYLQGIAGAETVRGIQSQGVMATIKHFVGNEQEHFRQSWEWGVPNAISSNIDDRTLHELYAWPFGDAIKAGVASVMCSYNMVNNSYACGNSKLMNGILKDELGFQGFVMSDWLAQRSGVASALAGLDMSMPGDGLVWQNGDSLWGPRLTEAVLNGSVPVDRLDDMVTRIVASWYQLGQDNRDLFDGSGPNFSSWTKDRMGITAPGSSSDQQEVEVNKFVNVQGDHHKLARQVAVEGTVLLKNVDKALPLSRDGSGRASQQGSKNKLRVGVFGEDAGPGNGPNYCADRGCNQGTLGSGWGSGAVEFPYLIPPIDALKREFNADKVELTQYLNNSLPIARNPSIAGDQDLCLVFANSDAGEGFTTWDRVGGDRNDLSLQKGGDVLVHQVAKHCGGDTIVVIHSVGPVTVDTWIDLPSVKAVVLANLPGQESGNALAEILFGDANPSGKLPYTMGKSLADYGPGGQILYRPNAVVPQQDFSEGLYIDYRHFDKHGIDPQFEFGFGLSYTTFELSDIKVRTLKEKSALPAPRPEPGAKPPSYSSKIPDSAEAAWPNDIRRLNKYIYPYLDSAAAQKISSTNKPYPYPAAYHEAASLSPAGGDEGGNPDLWAVHATVTVQIKNTGPVQGQAVPQLYLSYPDRGEEIDFPVRVLRGLEKLALDSAQSATVAFNLTRRDLSYWDVARQNWVMVTDGAYEFAVGQSSRDLPLRIKW